MYSCFNELCCPRFSTIVPTHFPLCVECESLPVSENAVDVCLQQVADFRILVEQEFMRSDLLSIVLSAGCQDEDGVINSYKR